MSRFSSLVAFAFVLLAGALAWAATPGEWPQWRGPNRDGVSTETGLLKTWPDDGPKLAWKAKGLGGGFASVAIAGGKIFTMGNRKKDQYLIALELDGGRELWATKVCTGDHEGSRSTPTIDGDLVFTIGSQGDLLAAETVKGTEVWRKSFSKDFGGKMMSGWGYCESPLVDGDRLICTPGAKDAAMVALNKRTGEVIWKCEIPDFGKSGGDGAGYSSIVTAEVGGIKQYVQLMGRGVIGVSAKDGKFLWGYNRIANGTANIPTPIVRGEYVFCSTGYGTGAALLKLVPDNGGIKAEEVYFKNAKELQNHHGGMVLIGDYLYGGHGHNNGFPICMDFKTGKIAWSQGRGPGTGSAAVAYADGNLYFRYENGLMALIGANPEAYELHGSFKIPEVKNPSWPHPVVAGGKLYLREQDALLCYEVK